MGFFHHIGTFLLFAATILLVRKLLSICSCSAKVHGEFRADTVCTQVITTISAPVVHDIGLLKVNLGNATSSHQTEVVFGTFGYCVTDTS